MIRLEFKEGTSNKFWELALDGAAYKVRWGRIGTTGQEKAFSFPSTTKAKTEADKLVAEKKKKGYVEVPLAGGAGKKAKAAAAAPASPRNPELEKVIAKDPDDASGYLVYADWLTAQGDPRGELVTIQHALSEMDAATRKGPRGKQLAKREGEILRQNERFLPDVSKEMVHVTWRWGFIESVRFNNQDDWMDDDVDVMGIAKRVLASPAIAGLVDLRIAIMRWDSVAKDVPLLLKTFGESPYGKQIRKLWVGPARGDEVDTGMYEPGKLDGISKYFPNLRTLTVHGHEYTLGAMNLPELRELAVETCGLSRKNLKSVLEAKWPALERLSIWFGSEDYGSQCKVKDLAPLLDGAIAPKLKHLGLMNSEFTDDIVRALATSKILKRIESLDLSLGTLSPDGARALVDAKKAFSHLKALDVSESFLRKQDIAELKKIVPTLVAKEQKEDDDSIEGEIHRYVTVAE